MENGEEKHISQKGEAEKRDIKIMENEGRHLQDERKR
jgi:hypothetical protein